MIYEGYFQSVGNAVEFLLAFAAVISFLAFIVGLVTFLTSSFHRWEAAKVMLISFVIGTVCGGLWYGIKYFRI
jgi:hypothetical protein